MMRLRPGDLEIWVFGPSLAGISCVSLGKSLYLFSPQCLYLKNEELGGTRQSPKLCVALKPYGNTAYVSTSNLISLCRFGKNFKLRY